MQHIATLHAGNINWAPGWGPIAFPQVTRFWETISWFLPTSPSAPDFGTLLALIVLLLKPFGTFLIMATIEKKDEVLMLEQQQTRDSTIEKPIPRVEKQDYSGAHEASFVT